MALEDIIKKINSETDAQIASIMSEAKTKANEILSSGKEEVDKIKSTLFDKANKMANEEGSRILTLENLEMRKEILEAKREMINKTFDEVKKDLTSLSGNEYQKLMKDLLLAFTSTGKEEVIIPSHKKKNWSNEFIASVNKELPMKNADLKISSEEGNFEDGFVLRENLVETDCTFDSIFRLAKERLETSVANILFTEG